MGKIRRNLYIDEELWDKLPKYIGCSRSEWIEQQIYKLINCNDDIGELQRKLNDLEQDELNLKFEKENLKTELEMKMKQQELNNQNFQLIEEAMGIIRMVFQNEEAIEETRIEFIANSKMIDSTILKEKCKKEGIKFIPK